MVRSALIAAITLLVMAAAGLAHAQGSRPAGAAAAAEPPPATSRVVTMYRSIVRQFTMRPTVRKAIETEQSQVELGQMSAAATTVTKNRSEIQPVGLRERFGLWRSKRNVTKTSSRLADQRSRAGDTVGTRDALAGLSTLQASGRERAEKRAFNNAIYVAKRTAGKRSLFEINRRVQPPEAGNLELGLDNLALAAELAKKPDALKTDPKLVRTARAFVKGAMKQAASQAKAGNPEAAWQLLDKASTAAGAAGLEFPELDARRMLVKAFDVNAVTQYKAGAQDDAAASLYQARAIQRSLDETPTRDSRSLEQKLATRMADFAKAQRAAESKPSSVAETRQPAIEVPTPSKNPILAENLPDPGITKVRGKDGGYFMVGTAGTPGNRDRDPVFTIHQSGDLTGWKPAGHVFAPGQWPTWAKGDFWAPEIHKVGKKYVVYYTARDNSGRLSIGAASADDVRGPYTDLGKPLIRDDRTGVIDSNLFHDSKGQAHLVWKLDGNDVGKHTPIYIQKLSADGMQLEGARHKILTNDQAWEGPLVEAPWVVQRGAYYYMFYSGNMYNTDRYATGVARSRSPYGPYEKLPEPVLHSNSEWAGPGHGTIVRKNGQDYYVYHAWKADKIGDPNPRMVLMDPVQWGPDGWPKIGNGTPGGAAPAAESSAH